MAHRWRTAPDGWSDATIVLALAAAAAVFYLVPWPTIYLPALVVLGVLSYWRLDLGLLLVSVLAPAFMAPKHFGTREFAPGEVVIVLDAAIAALHLTVGFRTFVTWRVVVRSRFVPPLCLLLLAGTASALSAADRHHALRAYQQVLLEPAAFFVLLLAYVKRASVYWLFGMCLIATGVTWASLGLVQFVTHRNLSHASGGLDRIQALYGSPDNLGLLLDRVIPFWVASLWLPARSAGARVLWAIVGALLSVALLLTFSRGAWLAVVAGSLFVVIVAFPWGRWLALGCLIVGALALAVEFPKVSQAFGAGHTGTSQRRVDLWRSSVQMIQDHPVLGVGPDNFLHYYPPTNQKYQCPPGLGYVKPEALQEPCLSHPHDEVLDFWLSTGLAGLVAFVWLQVVYWRQIRRIWEQRPGSRERVMVLGCAGAMIAALLHGLVDNSFFLMDLATLFWLLCALVDWLANGSAAVPA